MDKQHRVGKQEQMQVPLSAESPVLGSQRLKGRQAKVKAWLGNPRPGEVRV